MCDKNTANLILMELRNIKALVQKQPATTISIEEYHSRDEPAGTEYRHCKECGQWIKVKGKRLFCTSQCRTRYHSRAHQRKRADQKAEEKQNKNRISELDSFAVDFYNNGGYGYTDIQHLEFQTIADKAIKGIRMYSDDLEIIRKHIHAGTIHSEYVNTQRWAIVRRCSTMVALYEWVLSVSQGKIAVQWCTANDCNNIFTKKPNGRDRNFCSRKCIHRAYYQKSRSS